MRRTLLLAALAALIAAPGASARAISSNWAGWVVASRTAKRTFSTVAGSWTVPTVNCEGAAAQSASAYWVGLGGDSERAKGLEQIGTDSDCEHGRPAYYAWYELIPAESVPLRLRVRPGDKISAFTAVHGRNVRLRITNLSTRRRVELHRYTRHIDVSSAEWIVEAPLSCTRPQKCSETRLANFGSVNWLAAQATLAGRTSPIGSPRWFSSAIELQEAPIRETTGSVLISATPDLHPSRHGAFAVHWHSRPTNA